MQSGGISVYEFDNYRNFLWAAFQSRKKANRRFSLGAWSTRLDLKSSSTLIMILKGSRNPSSDLAEKMIRDLSLRAGEADYFRDLVSYEKAKTNERLRLMLVEKLAKRRPGRQFKSLETKVFKAISEWHYYTIRELADLPDFKEDPDWIQSRLNHKVTKQQIIEALKTLVELGLLERDSRGRLKYACLAESTFDIPDEGLIRFHEQMLEICRNSLRAVPTADREISGITFTCRQEDLPKLKAKIREFIKDTVSTSEKEHNAVYHLEVACVPLTKKEHIDP